MRIGIDLDNTLICYDKVFQDAAKESGLLPDEWIGTKEQLRDAIREKPNGEHLWQQLQGYVYSEGIKNAESFPGALRFVWRAKHQGHTLFVISHKTETPHHDPNLNLRQPALDWLKDKNLYQNPPKSLLEDVYFRSTRDKKIEKINSLGLDVLIDDLAEVIEHPLLSEKIQTLHFGGKIFSSWNMIENHLLGNIGESDCANLVIESALGMPLSCQPYNNGGNSSVWKADIEKNRPLTIKFYHNDFMHNDRRKAEELSIQLMQQHDVKNIPTLLATDENIEVSIFEHIDAHIVEDLDQNKIQVVCDFMHKLKSLKDDAGYNLPLASAACLSGKDILEQIKSRLSNLMQACSLNPDLKEFVLNEFNPVSEQIIEWAINNWPESCDFNTPLDMEKLTLTPSDLGAHNMLENAEGEIFFIDFEYFGLDDPVKTVSDFLLQPKNKMDSHLGKIWVENMINIFSVSDPDFSRRLSLAWPLYGLCWCLIMLNEFRADNWFRRKQSKGYSNAEAEKIKMQQLKKATELLNFIKLSYIEFPYAEIRVH